MILKAIQLKLINDFFNVLESSTGEEGFTTTIELNPAHIVYSGHFPGYPVTPGVIQMQIVHELLEKHFCKSLKLIAMPQCKFYKILNPDETSQLVVHIEFATMGDQVNVKARGVNDTDIFFKLESVYR